MTREVLLAVATENAATLQEARLCLGTCYEPSCEQLEALLLAAPRLRTLHADVACDATEARRLLRNEPPYEALRVRRLDVSRFEGDEAALLALAADLSAHAAAYASLHELELVGAPMGAAAALDAVVEAALACRLQKLELVACRLSPASAPALARLLGGSALTKLHIYGHLGHNEQQLLDEPAAVLLGNALRANTTLTSLGLDAVSLWRDSAAAVALLNALTAHPSLCQLDVGRNPVGATQHRAGAALGALVAANAPTLRNLRINESDLGDAGMGALVDALPHNTHLHTLLCAGNDMSEAFVRDRLLPAVRADLECSYEDEDD
jgi:hypothetical protein